MEEKELNEVVIVKNISFEDIEKANKGIKTLKIKRSAKDKKTGQYVEISKDYAEVSQRTKAFRQVYPTGFIGSDIVAIDLKEGYVVMKATVKDENGKELATAYAMEKVSDSSINANSMIENCDTSVKGRALGFCGFGIDTAIASAEEMKKVESNEEPKNNVVYATKEQVEKIRELMDDTRIGKMLKAFKIQCVEQLTIQDASKVIAKELKGK